MGRHVQDSREIVRGFFDVLYDRGVCEDSLKLITGRKHPGSTIENNTSLRGQLLGLLTLLKRSFAVMRVSEMLQMKTSPYQRYERQYDQQFFFHIRTQIAEQNRLKQQLGNKQLRLENIINPASLSQQLNE